MKNKIVTVTLTEKVVLQVQTNKFFVFSPFCLPICCKKEPNHCISQNTTYFPSSLRKIETIRSGELDSEMASKIQTQGAIWRLVFKNIVQACTLPSLGQSFFMKLKIMVVFENILILQQRIS